MENQPFRFRYWRGRDWTVTGLLDYCEAHSETERALFHKTTYAEVVLLAGEPEAFPTAQEIMAHFKDWYVLKAPMKELVALARARHTNGNQ